MAGHALRRATGDDVVFLVDVVVRARQPVPIEAVEGRLRGDAARRIRADLIDPDDSAATYVIVVDAQAAGRLHLRTSTEVIEVCGLQLMRERQRQGIGTSIIRELQQRARRDRAHLDLTVRKDNRDAQRLYERLGFIVTGESDNEHLMRWHPIVFAKIPILAGQRCVLRPFTADDAQDMLAIVSDPEVIHWTFPPTMTLTLELLRDWYGTRAEHHDRLDLAVTDSASGELLGEVVLYELDAATRTCTFRALLGPTGRGRGIGTEATALIVGYAFEEVGVRRIELEVYPDNHRAIHVYDKVGFRRVDSREDVHLRNGARVGEVLMATDAPALV